MITNKTTFKRNEEKFLFSSLSDEAVMMNMVTGDYITLDSVGANIWTILEKSMDIESIVHQLTEIYDISIEQCKTETLVFLNQMLEEEMILVE